MCAEANEIPGTRDWFSWTVGCVRSFPDVAFGGGALFVTRRLALVAIATGTTAAVVTSVTLHLRRPDPLAALRKQVLGMAAAPGSPLSADAADRMRPLFTPAEPGLPSFFAVPTRAGGTCVLSTDGVLAACSEPGTPANASGTFTAVDDVEGAGRPALVYGQTSPAVVSVSVRIDGRAYRALLADRFYLFELPDTSLSVSRVDGVVFTLRDGSRIGRGPRAS
jgi:hypothetical protein